MCMWAVPTALRPFAMSMSVVAIHVFGDVPSPPLLGALQGYLHDWRLRWAIVWVGRERRQRARGRSVACWI